MQIMGILKIKELKIVIEYVDVDFVSFATFPGYI